MFEQLIDRIKDISVKDFKIATEEIRNFIDVMPEDKFKCVVKEIGTIPENIEHDSTEEKLYSKASDILYHLSLYRIPRK